MSHFVVKLRQVPSTWAVRTVAQATGWVVKLLWPSVHSWASPSVPGVSWCQADIMNLKSLMCASRHNATSEVGPTPCRQHWVEQLWSSDSYYCYFFLILLIYSFNKNMTFWFNVLWWFANCRVLFWRHSFGFRRAERTKQYVMNLKMETLWYQDEMFVKR